nr:lipase maturation factor family protein [Myxococcota bacterium]
MSDDALVFGIGLRLLAAVQLIAFASLWRDVLGLAGARGISPVAEVLRASRRDFGWRRFVYFPSLLHLASSDRALRGWIALGAAASCVALVGGPWTPVAFAIAWLVYLSYDVAVDLLYPWDALLLEAGLLAVLAPPLALLPSLALEVPAHPMLTWAFRFLAFRVVFGFGKYKFFGPGKLSTGYLESFLVTQPLPRPLGLRLQRLPLPLHQAALAVLFLIEVLSPWLWLGPPALRWIPTVLVGALMLGIQLTGNFGFFNVATIAIGVIAATPTASALDLALARPPFALDAPHVLACALLALGLCHLPFHSWVSRSWMYWPGLRRIGGGVLAPVLAIVRALAPFRVVHAYGVFGPESGPPGQWVPVFEATLDGRGWAPYRYRHYPSDASFAGASVSPSFPRFDHALVYEAMGLGLGNLMGAVVGGGNPYRASRALFLERVQRRLLEGSGDVLALFESAPFGAARPMEVRVRFQFLSRGESAAGPSYRALPLGLHLPARSLATAEPLALPEPTAFLAEERVWTERAIPRDDREQVLAALAAIEPALARFDAAPTVRDALVLGELEREAMRAIEGPILRASWLLRAEARPVEGESELELWLRTLRAASRGAASVREALRTGVDAALARESIDDALRVLAMLRPTWVRFHARKA